MPSWKSHATDTAQMHTLLRPFRGGNAGSDIAYPGLRGRDQAVTIGVNIFRAGMSAALPSLSPLGCTRSCRAGATRAALVTLRSWHSSRDFSAEPGAHKSLRTQISTHIKHRPSSWRQHSAVVMVLTESKNMEMGTTAPSFKVLWCSANMRMMFGWIDRIYVPHERFVMFTCHSLSTTGTCAAAGAPYRQGHLSSGACQRGFCHPHHLRV